LSGGWLTGGGICLRPYAGIVMSMLAAAVSAIAVQQTM
jgi:hypothetical protein